MPQTKEGARKATETLKKRYGDDYHATIGQRGGQVKVPKGFAKNKKLASEAAKKRWSKDNE